MTAEPEIETFIVRFNIADANGAQIRALGGRGD
jgi:hypothetical protein